MKLTDFLNMDIGEVIDWLEDNQHDFKLVDNESIDDDEEAIAALKAQLNTTQQLLATYACNTGAGANDPAVHEALMFNIED